MTGLALDRVRLSRDAAATRLSIVTAARNRFARENYDRVGVRDIAADAGVDAALVIRYFGSKEGLLKAVLIGEVYPPTMADLDRSTFGIRMASMLVTEIGEGHELNYFMLLLRTAMVPSHAPMLKTIVEDRLMIPFAAWLGGKDAPLRAKLILSVVTGAALQMSLAGDELLSTDQKHRFESTLAALIQKWVDDDCV